MSIKADGYFLSAENPIANVDQRDAESIAMELIRRPELIEAREKAGYKWKAVMTSTAGAQMARFDGMMEEYMFNHALKAANADPNYPKVVRVYYPSAEWFGRRVPGSRWGGDNPDCVYRIVPIDCNARYLVHGQRMPGGVANVTYTLVADTSTSATLASLEGRDVELDENGMFTITIDNQPANGRRNHLQSVPRVMYLFIRDCYSDWVRETPNALRVTRLDAPSRGPMTLDEMAEFAAFHMVEGVYVSYWFTRLNYGLPPNTIHPPRMAGILGGLVSQGNSLGVVQLKDDEAMIVTATDGGAEFRNFVVHDVWFMSVEFWKQQSSLNAGQMAADADGRFTYVIAHEDPGVHNWVDTGGLYELYALHRWQGLPRGNGAPQPYISARVVKLKCLEEALPRGVKTVTAVQRKRQLERRAQESKRRFVDC